MEKMNRAKPNFNTRVTIISIGVLLLLLSALTAFASGQKDSQSSARLKAPRIAPLPESQWTEVTKKLLAPFKRNGHTPNIFTTLANNQKLLERYDPFGKYVLVEQSLPARDREILILRIGWLCQSEYEFGQHTLWGKRVGLTDEEILNITKGSSAAGWSAFDAALIQAVDELYYNALISDSTWKVLAEKYNDPQLVDLIFTIGQYNLVSWALNSMGVQRDEGVPGFPKGSK